jgi:cell shape-determining protein MreC
LEADILIKQEALTKIAAQEQEIKLLKEIALEKEQWREQATDLSQDNSRLRQVNEDLTMESRRQSQIIIQLQEKVTFSYS